MTRPVTLALVILLAGCVPALEIAAVSPNSVAINRRPDVPLQRSFDVAKAQCGGQARFRFTQPLAYQDRDLFDCVR